MALFLFRFWPVLLPLLCYIVWLRVQKGRALKAGQTPPHFRDGPLYWLVLASLLIAAACFAAMGFSLQGEKGGYVPPHMEGGTLVPPKVMP